MSALYKYENTTGRIRSTGSAPEQHIEMQAQSGETAVQGTANQLTQYHNLITDELTDRPANNYIIDTTTVAAYDAGTATITGVPAGAKIDVSGTEYVADGTNIELTFYDPGSYTVTIEDFPTLPFEVTIDAT